MIICSIHFFTKKNTIKFLLKRPSLKRTIRVCHLGVSSFIGEISSGVITVVFNYLILGLVGTVGVAAYGIIANYSLVAISIFNGIAQGAQPIISEAYGKGDKKTTKIIRSMGIKTAICIALMLMLVMMFFGEEAVRIFNHDNSETLMKYALTGIQIYFAGFLFAGYNVVIIGYLSATEQATPAFIASFARGLCLIIVVAIVFAKVFGLLGVWLAFATTECITAVFLFVHNKKGTVYEKA
jgi:Na+-driven multidrug efflux pump